MKKKKDMPTPPKELPWKKRMRHNIKMLERKRGFGLAQVHAAKKAEPVPLYGCESCGAPCVTFRCADCEDDAAMEAVF